MSTQNTTTDYEAEYAAELRAYNALPPEKRWERISAKRMIAEGIDYHEALRRLPPTPPDVRRERETPDPLRHHREDTWELMDFIDDHFTSIPMPRAEGYQ